MQSAAHYFRSFSRWLHDQIVQSVEENDALCEFDCRESECTFDRWLTCERRMSRAEGELMPEIETVEQS